MHAEATPRGESELPRTSKSETCPVCGRRTTAVGADGTCPACRRAEFDAPAD